MYIPRYLINGSSLSSSNSFLEKKNFSFQTLFEKGLWVYPGRFSPIEKIGEDLGCQISKRLVKIGKKDLKKDWPKDWLFALYTWRGQGEALSKDLGMHGDVWCAVWRRASQLRRAWLTAANRAFRRRRAHEISCFYVTFSSTELTGSFAMTTLRHSWRRCMQL